MISIAISFYLIIVSSSIIVATYSLQLAPGSQFTPFLHTCMHHLNLDHQLVPLAMDPSFTACIGNVGKVQVQFRAAAFTSPQLRYMRMVSFTGSGYDVFNLVAIPRSGTSLPILGIDIVSLPRGALAAIDFQPHVAERNELFQTHSTYQSIASCHAKWQTRLPSGGELPQEAQRYFSPFALWTRIPTTEPGRESKNDGLEKENLHHDDPWVVLGQALEEYVAAYASQLTTLSSDTSVENEAPMDEQFLQDYLTYRIEKDPAKRLLIGAFGAEWTDRALRDVMFPYK